MSVLSISNNEARNADAVSHMSNSVSTCQDDHGLSLYGRRARNYVVRLSWLRTVVD